MNRPLLPTARQRVQAAELNGVFEGWAREAGDWLMADAVADVHEISRDPAVLGDVLGGYLVRVETDGPAYTPTVEVLRAAGADEQVAAGVAEWLRELYARQAASGGPRT